MALEKSTKQDKIEIVDRGDWKCIQVRTATIITEDEKEISRTSFTSKFRFKLSNYEFVKNKVSLGITIGPTGGIIPID